MISIQSINALNEYLNGVMDRANHHAHRVNEVALTLAGAVMWRTTDDIDVRSNNNGGTWEYALVYGWRQPICVIV